MLSILTIFILLRWENFLINTNSHENFPTIICTISYTESRFKQRNVMQISPILLKEKAKKYFWLRPLYLIFKNKIVENKFMSYILGITHINFLVKTYRGNLRRVLKAWSKGRWAKSENIEYYEKFKFFYNNVCKDNLTSIEILKNHIISDKTPTYNY